MRPKSHTVPQPPTSSPLPLSPSPSSPFLPPSLFHLLVWVPTPPSLTSPDAGLSKNCYSQQRETSPRANGHLEQKHRNIHRLWGSLSVWLLFLLLKSVLVKTLINYGIFLISCLKMQALLLSLLPNNCDSKT